MPGDGFFNAGEVLTFTVTFSEPVYLTNTTNITLPITLGTSAVAASYVSGDTTNTLTFRYTVQAGDEDLDGILLTGTLSTGAAGTIKDSAGSDALLAYTEPSTSTLMVDALAPTIASITAGPAKTYKIGDVISLRVTFTQPVIVVGMPMIEIQIGSTCKPADYDCGSGTTDLIFNYTVVEGDLDTDGVIIAGPIQLGAGITIKDAADNNAGLAFTTPDTTGVLVDGVAPLAPVITAIADDIAPVTGTVANNGRTNDSALVLSGTTEANSTVQIYNGDVLLGLATVTGTNWTFSSPVLVDGDTYEFKAVAIDIAGNVGFDSLPYKVSVDTTLPTVVVTSTVANVNKGSTATIRFTLSEASTDFGFSDITATNGTLSNFIAVSSTEYTVDFTPSVNTPAVGVIAVNANAFSDATGNGNIAGSLSITINSVFANTGTAQATFSLIPNARTNPRATPVSVVTVTFNESVPFIGGVDADGCLSLADFELTRNGTVVPLPAGTRLISDPASKSFEISNLSSVTDTPGTYILTFADRQIGPRATTTWIKIETPAQLTATISLSPASAASPRITPVDSAIVVFSENVDNVDLSDFELRRDGVLVPWTGSTVTVIGSGNTYEICNLTLLTSTPGCYELTLLADDQATVIIESDIATYAGGQLIAPVTSIWVYTPMATIVSVTPPTPSASGFFRTGNVLTFTVRFTQPVFLTNTTNITMPFTLGTRTVAASYVSGDTTETLTFRYTVQAGDEDLDGILLTGTLNTGAAGTIKDSAGSDALLAYAEPDTSLDLIDAVAPTLSPIVVGPADGLYAENESVQFTATFSEPMLVTGMPRIALTVGTTTRYATYLAGSETRTLVFEYLPQVGHSDLNGIVAANVISLNGGAITDLAGNGCGLTFTALNLTNVLIDALAPNAPTLALGVGVANGATFAEATQTSGVVTVKGELDATITVIFSGVNDQVTQILTGTGGVQPVTLSAVDPDLLGEGLVSVSATQTDAAGNVQTAPPATVTFILDTVSPTIAITSNKAALKAGETATIMFTLSETSVNFTASDVTVTGGALSLFSGTGSVYTATFTPTADSTTPGTVSVSAARFTDTAGNGNIAGSLVTPITIDTAAPTVLITSSPAALKIGDAATITFTLSESSTTFSDDDVTETGGSLSGFTGSGSVYRAVFTPTASSTAAGKISIAANTFTDAAGNSNLTSTELTLPIDTIAPTITIVSDKAALKAGQTAQITFTLSENSVNFIAADVTTTGGTLSGFAGSGMVYTATFTPTVASTTPGTISVAAAQFTDPAGNGNVAGALSSPIAIDTVRPTIAIVSNKAALKIGETATITFTLSESSVNFSVDDLTATGGMLSGFAGSGSAYSVIFTPAALFEGLGQISLAANAFTDAAGNDNLSPLVLTIPIDTLAPTITIVSNKTTLSASETATITFTLSENSTTFTATDATATGGSLSGFTGSGKTYTALFTPTASSSTPGNVTVAAAQFTDIAGNSNEAGALASPITIDTVRPTIEIKSNKNTLKTGETATITFTLSENSVNFTAVDVTTVGGALSSFTGSGQTYTALFTPTVSSTTPGQISVVADAFTDAIGSGNIAGSLASSITIDTAAPTVLITSSLAALKIGDAATITFTLSESSTTFAAGDVTATGGSLSGFTGSGSVYTAVFTPAAGSTTAGQVSVAANTFTDSFGNNNLASLVLTLPIDTIAPTIVIASNKAALKIGETATITFTLTENSIDFTAADVTTTGGSLSGFTGSGSVYTAIFTPTTSSTTPGNVSVAAARFTDAAGNGNTAGSLAPPIAIDTAAPTVAIASSKSALKASDTATITFTLSEGSTNFTGADVTVTGGTLSGFTGSGTSYTALFTPTAASAASGQISVAANKFTDAAGNNNLASVLLTLPIDTVVPTITIMSDVSSLKIGELSTLSFTLSESSANFTAADVTVTGGTLSDFTGSGSSYTAIFTPDADSAASGTISVAANAFTDAAGNGNLAGTLAAPIAIDTIAPRIMAFSSSQADGVYATGTAIPLTATLSEAVQAGGAITVTLTTGAVVTLRADSDGTTLTGTYIVLPGDATLDLDVVSYQLAGNSVLDRAGNTIAGTTLPDQVRSLGALKNIVVDASIKASAVGFSSDPSVIADKKAIIRAVPITFNTPVRGVTLAAFRLFHNGKGLSLRGARVTGSGANYILRLPPNLAKFKGLYTLQVLPTTGIQAILNGAAMTQTSQIFWGYGKSVGIMTLSKAKVARRF